MHKKNNEITSINIEFKMKYVTTANPKKNYFITKARTFVLWKTRNTLANIWEFILYAIFITK